MSEIINPQGKPVESDQKQNKKLWAELATQRRRHTYAVKGLVTDRGAPKTPEQQLELVASLMQSNYDLAKMLGKVEPAMQRIAYEQMSSRVKFKVLPFEQVMKL